MADSGTFLKIALPPVLATDDEPPALPPPPDPVPPDDDSRTNAVRPIGIERRLRRLFSRFVARFDRWLAATLSVIVPAIVSRLLALEASRRDRLRATLADADRMVVFQEQRLRKAQQALEDELSDRMNGRGRRHSDEVPRMLRGLRRAALELARARDHRTALAASLERYDRAVAAITGSR